MPVITLTTDFGNDSFYVAAMKGSLLKLIPGVQVVDIDNSVKPFALSQAAFILRNSYPSFPEKTIHLIGVDMEISLHQQHLCVLYAGQYFIAADNGIFSLLFDQAPEQVYRITRFYDHHSDSFSGKNVFVRAAAELSRNWQLADIGEPSGIHKEVLGLQPYSTDEMINGKVVYIDHFGNVMTNISEALFEQVRRGRKFRIRLRRNDIITQISMHYSEVEEGEKLCLFGESGFLEIAVNRGEAARLIGLRIDTPVTIEFPS